MQTLLQSTASNRSSSMTSYQQNTSNTCCKKCRQKNGRLGKNCLCQVPRALRRQQLPSSGCKNCGCHGCSSISTVEESLPLGRRQQLKALDFRQQSPLSSSPSPSYLDEPDFVELSTPLRHAEDCLLGQIIGVQYGISPHLLGFGVPQRSFSYIFGRPPN